MTSPNPFAPPDGATPPTGTPSTAPAAASTTAPTTAPSSAASAAQPFPAQPYEPSPSQAYPTQPYPSQAYPSQPYPSQQYPGQPYLPAAHGVGPFPNGPHQKPAQLRTGMAQAAMYTGLGALVVGLPFTLGVGAVVCGLIGVVLGAVALRRIGAGTAGGRPYAWWGIALSAVASMAGVPVFLATAPDLAESFQAGWEEGWEEGYTGTAGADAPADDQQQSLYDDAWSDGYDAGFADGYSGVSDPIAAPGTEDSAVDADDVPQHPFGEAGTVGVYAVTVLDVSLDADDVMLPAFPGNVPPEGRYVMATVSVTNTGAEPARPATTLYHYYAGDDDLLYGSPTCRSWSPRPLADVGPLDPGETAEYDICFDVPLDALGRPTLVIDDGTESEYTFTQWSAPDAG